MIEVIAVRANGDEGIVKIDGGYEFVDLTENDRVSLSEKEVENLISRGYWKTPDNAGQQQFIELYTRLP